MERGAFPLDVAQHPQQQKIFHAQDKALDDAADEPRHLPSISGRPPLQIEQRDDEHREQRKNVNRDGRREPQEKGQKTERGNQVHHRRLRRGDRGRGGGKVEREESHAAAAAAAGREQRPVEQPPPHRVSEMFETTGFQETREPGQDTARGAAGDEHEKNSGDAHVVQ